MRLSMVLDVDRPSHDLNYLFCICLSDFLRVWSMLQQQGVSLELAEGLKAWFPKPWHTASPLSPTPHTPPPLRQKPTETSHPTNSPPCRRQHIPSPLEAHPHLYPPGIRHSPTFQYIGSASLTWCGSTVLFLRWHNQPRSDLSTASPIIPSTLNNTDIPPSSSPFHPFSRRPLPLPLPHNVSNNCSQGFNDWIGLYP